MKFYIVMFLLIILGLGAAYVLTMDEPANPNKPAAQQKHEQSDDEKALKGLKIP